MRGTTVGLNETCPNRVVSPAATVLQKVIPNNMDNTIIDKILSFMMYPISEALLGSES